LIHLITVSLTDAQILFKLMHILNNS